MTSEVKVRVEGLGVGSESVPKHTDHTIHKREEKQTPRVYDTPFPAGRGLASRSHDTDRRRAQIPREGMLSSSFSAFYFSFCTRIIVTVTDDVGIARSSQ